MYILGYIGFFLAKLPRMFKPIVYATAHISLDKAAVHASYEDSMEVDDNNILVVDNPQGILCQQLSLHPIPS